MPRRAAAAWAALLAAALLAPAAGAAAPASKEKPEGKEAAKGAAPKGPTSNQRLTTLLLQELETKRRILLRREASIRREETRLNELRADIKKRFANLKQLEDRLKKVIEKAGAVKDERINHLVRAYTSMSPDAAAELINSLDINLAVRILRNMKVKKAGAILAVVQPRRAARISELLARTGAR
ncbi:MAG: hypothetical protein V3V62_01600 [bacterium]